MRIPSGTTDQYIYFYGVDATDFTTPETGLATWTVYRSRDGAAATIYTTPTINETSAANMPGVYELLVDEDTTIAAGNDSEEMVLFITHAGMAPVVRTIEIYRPKITLGETLTTSSGLISNTTAIASVTTLTGHTPQTGDTFALANGAAGFAAIDTVVDSILADTADMQPKLGAPAANISADIAAVKVDTAAILVDTGTDGVVVAAGSKTGYTLTATTGLGNQTADITGTVSTVTTLTNLPAITANWLTATGIAADAGAKIADIVRRRTQANVESSGDGDALSVGSLYGLIQQAQESEVSGATLTVYRTDGSTSIGTKTLVGDAAADPIIQIS